MNLQELEQEIRRLNDDGKQLLAVWLDAAGGFRFERATPLDDGMWLYSEIPNQQFTFEQLPDDVQQRLAILMTMDDSVSDYRLAKLGRKMAGVYWLYFHDNEEELT